MTLVKGKKAEGGTGYMEELGKVLRDMRGFERR